MGDVASMLRSCGERSLVFVDELGRGTSPRDGTCLAGALLEAMSTAGMNGMFATHLHGVLDLPLTPDTLSHLVRKRMAYRDNNNLPESVNSERPSVEWTYKLEDGVCTDSLALITAAKFGVPEKILQRAEALSQYFNNEIGKRKGASLSPSWTSIESTTTDLDSLYTRKNGSRPMNDAKKSQGLDDVINLAEALSEEVGKAIHIPPRWTPPASLEGRSCVYIIELGIEEDNALFYSNSEVRPSSSQQNSKRPRYYVGETDSISQRLLQHRRKGGEWAMSSTIALSVRGGKSQARNIESLLIQKLAKTGFDLISTSDGRKIRSVGSPDR